MALASLMNHVLASWPLAPSHSGYQVQLNYFNSTDALDLTLFLPVLPISFLIFDFDLSISYWHAMEPCLLTAKISTML